MNINNEAFQMGTIYLTGSTMVTVVRAWEVEAVHANAAVNVNLDPTLSKGRQAFGVNSTSHLHLQKIEVG